MEIAVVILGIIILAQAIERYFFAKELHRQLENTMKAVMSRNIGDYLAATKDNKPDKEIPPQNDEVILSEATDEQFNKHIKVSV